MTNIVTGVALSLVIIYLAGAAVTYFWYAMMWRGLKRGIVKHTLTEDQMAFMDALRGEEHPMLLGFLTVVLWPEGMWDAARAKWKGRGA